MSFKKIKKALFARWITDWDCGYETEWWYVIKDTPFDINKLKSKRRYEITKGIKNFYVIQINPTEYVNEICKIAFNVWKTYPSQYRPNITEKKFCTEILEWKDRIIYGAFNRENNNLCGYAVLKENKNYISFIQLKSMIEFEKKGLNFALVNKILEDYSPKLNKNFYISDGARNIIHETHFQDFLEKYFDFRKAYCKLVIKYRFPIKIIVKILKPFRNIINTSSSLGYKIKATLLMDDIFCKCNKIKKE